MVLLGLPRIRPLAFCGQSQPRLVRRGGSGGSNPHLHTPRFSLGRSEPTGGERCFKGPFKGLYAQNLIVFTKFRANLTILTCKFWFSHGLISIILV